MRGFNILITAPLALAASVYHPRAVTPTAADVNIDITGISTAVSALTAALEAYKGGITEADPVFNATLAVHAINRKGYADAVASTGPYSDAASKAIVKNVQDSVGVTIPASVKALEAKKPQFDAANLTSLIEATIVLLRYDHDSFSLAVGDKLSADEVAAGAAAAGKIDAVLAGAETYYAT